MSSAHNEYSKAQRSLREEARKMEAGKPHKYRAAYDRFCEATRALNAENSKRS